MTHSFPTRRSSDLLTAFLGDKGTPAAELERTINSNVRALPRSIETSGDVMGGIRSIVQFDRPVAYDEKLPTTYEALTAAERDAASRKAQRAAHLSSVAVGEAPPATRTPTPTPLT